MSQNEIDIRECRTENTGASLYTAGLDDDGNVTDEYILCSLHALPSNVKHVDEGRNKRENFVYVSLFARRLVSQMGHGVASITLSMRVQHMTMIVNGRASSRYCISPLCI